MIDVENANDLSGLLSDFRGALHRCAEISGAELLTAQHIADFLSRYQPDEIIQGLGGFGLAAVFRGERAGPRVLIRADMDALPAHTVQQHPEIAVLQAAHRCGHDGHMAIVAGLAPLLAAQRPPSGECVLLFQPAEETGQGAAAVIADAQFEAIKPDFAIALHNIPGYPEGAIVWRYGTFASASVGVEISFQGIASHACEPEKARAPTQAIAGLLVQLEALSDFTDPEDYALVTITHAQLGQKCFGSAPEYATLCATLRAANSDTFERLRLQTLALVETAAQFEGLQYAVEWVEAFPETRSDDALVNQLCQSADKLGLQQSRKALPFRWSEDFGHFSKVCPSLYFGLGIGEGAPGLHHPDYYFADSVITHGVDLFYDMMCALVHC